MIRLKITHALVLTLLAVCACDKKESSASQPSPELGSKEDTAKEEKPNVDPHAALKEAVSNTSDPAEQVGIVWEAPSSFEKAPQKPMRIASYSVPKAAQESENGDVSISYFGAGAGGTVEANLSRWIGQFSDVDPKSIERKTRTVAGYEQHLLEILGGSYSSMMSPTPMKDFGMLGAVVETESGSYFFKLIGPKTLVERSRTDFYKLLDSVHQSEKSGH